MPLSPLDRKAELVRRGVRLTDVARELELSKSHVGQVLHGLRRHQRTEVAIADHIGLPHDAVFPPIPDRGAA